MMETKEKLDVMWLSYLQVISNLARQIYKDQVEPFCQKHNYEFTSSMVTGEWAIVSKDDKSIMGHYKCVLNDEEALNLYDTLRLRVSGISGDLATLMPNFEAGD